MQWFGKPTPQNRFLGQVDQDDPTNLPMGLAAVCRNFDFTRDSGGPTSAAVRAGINTALQCVDPTAAVTGLLGFVYAPVSALDSLLTPDGSYVARCQRPLAFQATVGSQYEAPLGTGRMVAFPQTNFSEPRPANKKAHAIQASAGNQVFSAYSDLIQPLGGLSTMDPKALTLNPFGMKPFGWNWVAASGILAGEVCTPSGPSTGNGHTYQAQNAGTTGATEPVWPLSESGTVVDNAGLSQVVWKELTLVIANRLPPPLPPVFAAATPGTIPVGRDVYVVMTLLNTAGETLPSLPEFWYTVTAATVNVQVPLLAALPGWIQGLSAAYVPTQAKVYVAIVAHATPAPALATYQLYGGAVALGTLVNVAGAGAGAAPPTSCTARVTPGQLPIPTSQPGINRSPGAGSFPAGRDVYVLQTYTNPSGETPAGPANSVINTNTNDGVQVTVSVPLGANNSKLYEIASVGIYEADVATGVSAPPASAFSLVGYYQPGTTPVLTGTAVGVNPPLTNSTGTGGAIVANTATGGANGTQGYRYAACGWINQMETFSGFTLASVVKTIIDEDGWEIGVFNVALGMANVVGRYIAFTIADASQAGPFDWIGLVNLQVPSQNVVYPQQPLIDQVRQSATVFLDNVTTQGIFNFTETYLSAQNNVNDRLNLVIPPQGVRVDYLESLDRVVVSGVPGLTSGGWISLGSDYESFYGDNSPVPIRTSGQRCFGWTDAFKGIPFALMEESGFTVSPNTGNPNSWDAKKRWSGMGPCGFRAWDANGKMIVFAHRSGLYKYAESDPDMLQKEVPKLWSSINWAAGETVSVTIDEDTHTIRVLVPTGASLVPNQDIVLSYIEGWNNPIHFSTFSGKEISMDAARRWSPHDVSAFLCVRMKRTLPAGGNAFIDGPSWNALPDSSYQLTQLLYASSGPDGTVQARTPGVFSDNGAGIDYEYETMSTGMLQALCKPEGFNLNACGWGTLFAAFIASRDEVSDEGGEQKLIQVLDELQTDPIPLSPRQTAGITRKCGPSINEFWRVRFTGDRQPGSWVSLKALTTYVIPTTGGRDSGDQ